MYVNKRLRFQFVLKRIGEINALLSYGLFHVVLGLQWLCAGHKWCWLW